MESEATEVSLTLVVKVEGLEGTADVCLEVAKQPVDPAKLWKDVGVIHTSDDGLMVAACRDDQGSWPDHREHSTAGSQDLSILSPF